MTESGSGETPDQAVELEQLRLAVDVLRLALQRLQGDLAQLRAGQLDLSAALPPPWNWRALDREDAAALWQELADWVGWLCGRYPLADVLPQCWRRHPELVEELTAVYVAWQAAYELPGANPTAPAEWHDRWLPGLEHRLVHRWRTGRCIPAHTDRPERSPPARGR